MSILFNNSSTLVEILNGGVNQISGDITVSLWFKDNGGSGFDVLMGNRESVLGWEVFIQPDNDIGFEWSPSGGGTGFVVGTTDVRDGLWHYVVAIRDGSSGRIYLDGVLEPESESAALGGDISANRTTYIGERRDDGANYFNGPITEIVISDAVLPDEEIIARAFFGVKRTPALDSNVVAYYSMNNGPDGSSASGSNNVIDESGNGNHGSGNSTTLWNSEEKLIDEPSPMLPIIWELIAAGGLQRYHDLNGLGAQGFMTWNPLG